MTAEEQPKMEPESSPGGISLVIPCKPEYIGLCRLVTGVIGARESLDEEDIADLKLVVTEACTCFLWGPEGSPLMEHDRAPLEGPCSLRVDFTVQPEAWEITVSDPEHGYHTPGGAHDDHATGAGIGLTIIRALVDSVEHTDTEAEGSVVHLVKRFSKRATRAD